MKRRDIFIGDDALVEIRRALTVSRLAQSGTNPVFLSIARKILMAEDEDSCIILLTQTDKQNMDHNSELQLEGAVNEDDRTD